MGALTCYEMTKDVHVQPIHVTLLFADCQNFCNLLALGNNIKKGNLTSYPTKHFGIFIFMNMLCYFLNVPRSYNCSLFIKIIYLGKTG